MTAPDTHGTTERGSAPATAAGTFAPTHAILCRCADCLADGYGYTPSIEPDPSLIEDGAA